MQFRLGNVFVDDVVVEAELIFTSKISRMSRKFNVSVYADQPVLAPNGSRRVVSRAFPRRANVQFGLNMTLALKAWSLSSERIYNLKVIFSYRFVVIYGTNWENLIRISNFNFVIMPFSLALYIS